MPIDNQIQNLSFFLKKFKCFNNQCPHRANLWDSAGKMQRKEKRKGTPLEYKIVCAEKGVGIRWQKLKIWVKHLTFLTFSVLFWLLSVFFSALSKSQKEGIKVHFIARGVISAVQPLTKISFCVHFTLISKVWQFSRRVQTWTWIHKIPLPHSSIFWYTLNNYCTANAGRNRRRYPRQKIAMEASQQDILTFGALSPILNFHILNLLFAYWKLCMHRKIKS